MWHYGLLNTTYCPLQNKTSILEVQAVPMEVRPELFMLNTHSNLDAGLRNICMNPSYGKANKTTTWDGKQSKIISSYLLRSRSLNSVLILCIGIAHWPVINKPQGFSLTWDVTSPYINSVYSSLEHFKHYRKRSEQSSEVNVLKILIISDWILSYLMLEYNLWQCLSWLVIDSIDLELDLKAKFDRRLNFKSQFYFWNWFKNEIWY